MNTTFYRTTGHGKYNTWSVWIEPDNPAAVTVEWGQEDGAMQRSTTVMGSKGKAGTKAFKTPAEAAVIEYDRLVKAKFEEGYRNTKTLLEPDWLTDGLDKQFVPAKPINGNRSKVTYDVHKLMWQRKRNGQRHLVLIMADHSVRIYSRRIEDMTQHFPLMVKEIERLQFPAGTIIDGEMFVNRNGVDIAKAISSITRAKWFTGAEEERRLFEANELFYCVFDVLWWNGAPVWTYEYQTRYNMLKSKLQVGEGRIFCEEELIFSEPANAVEHSEKHQWEGVVAWMRYEPTKVRIGGKPDRTGCVKFKPVQEEDFIAVAFDRGSGNQSELVGSLHLARISPTTGKYVSCGKCGTGFDMATRQEALTWEYPCVVAIKFDSRDSKSGKLIFPSFLKLHEDKVVEECIEDFEADDE